MPLVVSNWVEVATPPALRRSWRHLASPGRWPAMQDVLGHERARRFGEGAKYTARLWVSGSSRHRFMGQLAVLPEWSALFENDPAHYFIPLRSYLDRRWGVGRRFEACAQDLAAAQATFGPARSAALRCGQPVLLCGTSDFSIHLGKNTICCHEGFWALTLSDAQGQALFNLSFGFLGSDRVLIASIQGVQKASESAQDTIRTLTKRAHGLRPQAMLLNVFQMLCQQWSVRQVLAIDPEHQIKYRKRSGGKGFTFDYRALWEDAGGARQPDGYWLLPNALQERQPSEIPSHKRAMYARRYGLRNHLAEQMRLQWTPGGLPDAEQANPVP
ncbi:hypothetical protein DBV10_04600 [Acidovorax sp. FJL06]|nr:hypothetical protein DBV10_04600 [Acidovorax sp. FJL06]